MKGNARAFCESAPFYNEEKFLGERTAFITVNRIEPD